MAKNKANRTKDRTKQPPKKADSTASKTPMMKAPSATKPPAPARTGQAEIVPSKKPSAQPAKNPAIEITPEIRRLWIRMRQAWVVSYDAFNNSVASMDERQANMMYDVVKLSLFKDNHAQVLREHPELKPLLQTDDDRLCMHDVYGRLSFRLNRREQPPSDRLAAKGMKGGIGRNIPDLEV